jgi:diaminopimelate dehydrogenase
MKKFGVAIIGYGKVGRACGELLLSSYDLALAGIIRRQESLAQSLPDVFHGIPVASHLNELREVRCALLCVPSDVTEGMAHDILQGGIPLVECAMLHGQAFHAHKEAIHRAAIRHKVPAIVGAGWDPGAASLFRSLFAMLIPNGHTQTTHRSGKNLHHTITVESVPGVKNALCTEHRTPEGRLQRYIYVEMEQGADQDRVIEAIRADPLFLQEETLVFPVDTVAALEEQGQGLMLERRGRVGQIGHQHLLMEARGDVAALTAEVMLSAARALPTLQAGAYSLHDIPLANLWGTQHNQAEAEWI